ncbi:MAG TPA: nucleotide exchange factor GrpE [Terriglobales bacterium]
MFRKSEVKTEHEELQLPEEQPGGPSEEVQLPNTQSSAPSASAGGASQEEYERLKSERDSLLDRLARLQAEFDNYRKRNAREQAEFREYAMAEAARNFLPVLDNFNLALKAEAPSQNLRQGIELIRKQMEEALVRMGVQPIAAEGEQFNPHLHEAIEMVETSDVPDHQIIEELQRGYKVKDRLLRPAMVRVARNATSKAS